MAEQLQSLAHYKHQDHSAAVNADMVSKWERGEKGISAYYRDLLCLLFEATPEILGLPNGSVSSSSTVTAEQSETEIAGFIRELDRLVLQLGPSAAILSSRMVGAWRSEAVRRGILFKLTGSLTSHLPALLPEGESKPKMEASITDLDDLGDRYQKLYHSASPEVLIHPVVVHLEALADNIRSSSTDSARRSRLQANRARVALLAGRLSFFDLGDPLSARGYYNLSIEASTEAGDPRQTAAALGHLAFIPAAERNIGLSMEYLEAAREKISQNLHGPLLSWLHAVASEFYSQTGDNTAALKAIDSAKHSFDRAPASASPSWFDYYDANRLAGFSGYAHLNAGRYDDAASELLNALNLPMSAIKQRSVFLADLATVYCRAGEVDRACEVATGAADELERAGYATGLERLRDFHALVSAEHKLSPSVRAFSERLITFQPGKE